MDIQYSSIYFLLKEWGPDRADIIRWVQPKIKISNPEQIASTFARVACFKNRR